MKSFDYLAGLFDGEGMVIIDKNVYQGGNPQYALHIQIEMWEGGNSLEIMKEFHARFGGTLDAMNRKTATGKRTIRWSAYSTTALNFLVDIEPHLHIKREQALEGIDFQSLKELRGKSRKPLTEDELKSREQSFRRLKELNGRD